MAPKKTPVAGEILQGTLDMLILRTLRMGPAHGHTIAQVIEHTSENALEVEQGSLYPALHRLEDRGLLSSEWGVSDNNRRAKFYRLTAKGREELVVVTSRWQRMRDRLGLDVNVEALTFHEPDRSDAAQWLSGHGWQVHVVSNRDEMARLGRAVPQDLADDAVRSTLLRARLDSPSN